MRYLYLLVLYLLGTVCLQANPSIEAALNLAQQSASRVDWDSASVYLTQIRKECLAKDDLTAWISACKKVGVAADEAGYPLEALPYFNQGLEDQLWRPVRDSLEWDALGWLHVNMAFVYAESLEQYQKALSHYQKAKAIIADRLKVEDFYTGRYIYKPMGNIYTRLGDYSAGKILLQKYIAISSKEAAIRHVAMGYSDLSILQFSNGEHEAAINSCKQVLGLPGLDLITVGLVQGSLAKIYADLERSQEALDAASAAESAFHQAYEQYEHQPIWVWKGGMYGLMGGIYTNQEKWQEAEQAYQQAYQAYEAYYDGDHFRNIAKLQLAWGNLKKEQGNLDEALNLFQQALRQIISGFEPESDWVNPKPEQLFAENTIQQALLEKANILALRYTQSRELRDLEVALDCHKLIFEVEQQLRQSYNFETSKLASVEETRMRCEAAIGVALNLWEVTQDASYKYEAFGFAERSKSILLLEASRKASAEAQAGIPLVEQEQEAQFQWQIAQLERRLFMEEQESDSLKLVQEKQLLDLRQAYKNWQDELEQNFPAYYNLKYRFDTPSLESIREGLMSDGQALIEYFVGKDAIYVFYIKSGSFEILNLSKDFPLEEWVIELRNAIEKFQFSDQDRSALCAAYTEKAFLLYERLLAPLADLPENLLIIPSGILGFLPFDALLTAIPQDACNFQSYPYLVKKHIVQYSYSCNLQLLLSEQQPAKNASFAGFAPRFDGSGGFSPLSYTAETINAAIEHLDGTAFLDQEATISHFQSSAASHSLLQLATHAQANPEQADFSFIVFSNGQAGYDTLFVKEVYLMELAADLVVLSACETALGKLYEGEGIISLARAFLYAGAKSVITTLWQINDDANMELMGSFYKYLRAGESKATALQKAKLDYLEKNDELFAHPVYWAAFTPIGNMKPVYSRNGWLWWFVGMGIGFGMLALGQFRKKK